MTSKFLHRLSYLFILSVCIFFISCATKPSLENEKTKVSYSYKTVEFSEELDFLKTNIKYPEFEGLTELNKRISNTIMSNWKSFKSYSQTEWNEIFELNNRGSGKFPSFEYLVTFDVSNSDNIVSVLLNTYIFNGGAHGNTNLAAFNYDVSTSKFINIQQASGMTYNDISSIVRNKLYKKLIEDDKTGLPPSEQDSIREMINTGAFPQPGNFEIFTIDENKIYVYFEPYSVAPYSYGIQKVQIK